MTGVLIISDIQPGSSGRGSAKVNSGPMESSYTDKI